MPPGLKRWNGTSYVDLTGLRRWNGSAYVDIPSAWQWSTDRYRKLWPPSMEATDNFDRANNTNLGALWTETGGDLGINTNRLAVQGTTANRRAAIWNTQTYTPYQYVQFTIGTAPNSTATAGAVVRCNAAMTEMVILATHSGGWNLGRITGINGTYTAIGSQSQTIATGNVVRLEVDENHVYSVFINGVKSGASYRDTTWGDNSHRNLGLFVQRVSTTNSHALDNFTGGDVQWVSPALADDFNRAALGPDWTTHGGATMYLTNNELCAVGLLSQPVSFAFNTTPLVSETQVVKARVRWNGRNPEHSSMSIGLRANPAASHTGAHFWFTATLMGICNYAWTGDAFTAATGTADFVSTTKFPEGAVVELRAQGTTYTALVDGVPKLQGTFTNAQVPLANRHVGFHGEDDSAVSGGGEPPANLDEWRAGIR